MLKRELSPRQSFIDELIMACQQNGVSEDNFLRMLARFDEKGSFDWETDWIIIKQ